MKFTVNEEMSKHLFSVAITVISFDYMTDREMVKIRLK